MSTQKPRFKTPAGLPPCVSKCPAGIDIPRYLRCIEAGKIDVAVSVIREKNPFPAVCGYVCPHPCEMVCQAGKKFGQPIAIRALHRYVGENAASLKENKHVVEPTGKRVAVVGGGLTGLTGGYYLARLGHEVIVYEAEDRPGGWFRTVKQSTRLPKEALDMEIEHIEKTGVTIKTGSRVESIETLFENGFNAIFIALGSRENKSLNLDTDTRTLQTSRRGVFAGGYYLPGRKLVVKSIADGRRAAYHIDQYLGGTGLVELKAENFPAEFVCPQKFCIEIRNEGKMLPVEKRVKKNVAVECKFISEEEAAEEAGRCLRCDLPITVNQKKCMGCLTCSMMCSFVHQGRFNPMAAYIEVFDDYASPNEIAFSAQCDDCGVCALYCPYGALRREPIVHEIGVNTVE